MEKRAIQIDAGIVDHTYIHAKTLLVEHHLADYVLSGLTMTCIK